MQPGTVGNNRRGEQRQRVKRERMWNNRGIHIKQEVRDTNKICR